MYVVMGIFMGFRLVFGICDGNIYRFSAGIEAGMVGISPDIFEWDLFRWDGMICVHLAHMEKYKLNRIYLLSLLTQTELNWVDIGSWHPLILDHDIYWRRSNKESTKCVIIGWVECIGLPLLINRISCWLVKCVSSNFYWWTNLSQKTNKK